MPAGHDSPGCKVNGTKLYMKDLYKSPVIVRTVTIDMDEPLLAGSVVEKRLEVDTAGQQAVDHDFSDASSFNTEWK